MPKTILIVRGAIGASAGGDVKVINNPQPISPSRSAEIVSTVNPDDLIFTPPGSATPISLKDFKVKEGL